jgi:hypothetical protein
MFKPSMIDEQINITRGFNMAFGQLSATLLLSRLGSANHALNIELIDTLL